MRTNTPCLLALALASTPALAQNSDVDAAHKRGWGENIGWGNWRDAGDPDGEQGVELYASFLAGYIWGENTGWLTLGDGSPGNGSSYSNTNGSDCGVNLNPSTGDLSGYAWGENIGWVNFSGGAMANPPRPARFDMGANRLRGFAWGENVGWINLDDDEHFVGFLCAADFNGDGVVDTRDVLAFLNAWVAKNPTADCDGNGIVDTRDVLCFLNLWTSGC